MPANDCEPVVIPLSRTKILLLSLASALFVIGGIWLISTAGERAGVDQYIHIVAGTAGVAFFGLCYIYLTAKLLDRRPGLVIDSEGIIDNSGGVSAGRIDWHDVQGFSQLRIHSQVLITIHVADPIKYINRGNVLRRWLMRLNLRYYGSPIHIFANSLQIDALRLKALLDEGLANHTAAASDSAE